MSDGLPLTGDSGREQTELGECCSCGTTRPVTELEEALPGRPGLMRCQDDKACLGGWATPHRTRWKR